MAKATLPKMILQKPYRPQPMSAYFQKDTLQTFPKTPLLGKIWISPAYHKERSMNRKPQDTLVLAALPSDERTRALERYRMLQPCVEHDVPLTHITRQHGIAL